MREEKKKIDNHPNKCSPILRQKVLSTTNISIISVSDIIICDFTKFVDIYTTDLHWVFFPHCVIAANPFTESENFWWIDWAICLIFFLSCHWHCTFASVYVQNCYFVSIFFALAQNFVDDREWVLSTFWSLTRTV